jgi:hypothetical protein
VYPKQEGLLLHFRSVGPLSYHPDNSVDVTKSPLVSALLPRERRGFLWTIGEVHFPPTPLRGTFPLLDQVCRQFSSWLAQFPLVFSRATGFEGRWNYFLEGSVRNLDGDIFGLPDGMRALHNGRYFVSHDDNEQYLEKIANSLRLRGINIV